MLGHCKASQEWMNFVSHLFAACLDQSTTARHHRRPNRPLAMWQRLPATPGALPPPTVPLAVPPPPPGQARKQAVDLSGQNLRLKAAWTAAGYPNLCGEGSPFCDATQPSNRQAVMPLDAPALSICLSVALRGSCFSGCMQSHAPLSA